MSLLPIILAIIALLLLAARCARPVARWRAQKQKIKRQERVELLATNKILKYVCDYDPQSCSTLDEFQTIVQNTHCLFAKKAKIWASRPWDEKLSLEENVHRSIPSFIKWVTVGEELDLDGFVFQIKGPQYGATIDQLCCTVKRVFKYLCDQDPAQSRCMYKSYVGKLGWRFQFCDEPFFITTFAPCYPAEHSRYAYGDHSTWILFQPGWSFEHKDAEIGPDSPDTHWTQPRNMRDKIRINFKRKGQPYYIPKELMYPAAILVVRPQDDFQREVVQWWNAPM